MAEAEQALEGFGVGLIRTRTLALRVQTALERLYRLDRVVDVADFVCSSADGERESVLLREADDGAVELSVRLPHVEREASLDVFCQVIEGVSHFVYLVERVRVRREATQLELEVQAEVDKWVVLAASTPTLDAERSAELRVRLYERVLFEHDADSESGERYRVANEEAHRFVRRLEREFVEPGLYSPLRAALFRFFHLGQEEKLRVCRAA